MTALSGGNGSDIVKSTAAGFLSGGIGGSVGAGIGGGAGAFFGGATSSGLNTAFMGGSPEDIGKSALLGGAMSFGAYHATSYVGWKFQGGNKMGSDNVSYKQFTKVQAEFQRSRFSGRERGGYLMNDGTVKSVEPGSNSQIDLGAAPDGAFAEFHTHWDKPGQVRYVDGNGNYSSPENTYVGDRVEVIKTARYHGANDFNTRGLKSVVINRYDGSYYSRTTNGYNYMPINPPITRFVNSFYFWR